MSIESEMLTFSWTHPASLGRVDAVDGYQFSRVADPDPDNDDHWTALTITPTNLAAGSQALTTGLVDGLQVTFSVRAYGTDPDVDNDTGTTVDESRVYGTAASITAMSWPDVTVSIDQSIPEGDDATLTIGSGVSVTDFDVILSVVDEAEAGLAALVTFDEKVTFRAGEQSKTVTVTAKDNKTDAGAADPTLTFAVKLVPDEAADRDAVETDPGLTIVDDDDAPTEAPTTLDVEPSSGNNYLVTWAFSNADWGTSEVGRKFQRRTKVGAFANDDDDTDFADEEKLWTDVSGGYETTRSVLVELEPPETGTTTYNIQVRAVSEAGAGESASETETVVAPPA